MVSRKSDKQISDAQFNLTAKMLVAFVALTAAILVFVAIANRVLQQSTPHIDTVVLGVVRDGSNKFLDAIMPVITHAGGVVGVMALTVMLVGVFWYKREYRRAAIIALSTFGVMALSIILKAVFMRDRPDALLWLIHETGYSFPSAHAMMSAALGVSIVAALWNSRWRWWAVGAATIYIVAIGFSRLYLSVHYPTDIVAGWCVGIVWAITVVLVLKTSLPDRVRAVLKK